MRNKLTKTVIVIAAALLLALGVVVSNVGDDVSAINGSASSPDGAAAESGNLPSLPPLILIDNTYAGGGGTFPNNNCNGALADGTEFEDGLYWLMEWNFVAADLKDFPGGGGSERGGLDSSVAATHNHALSGTVSFLWLPQSGTGTELRVRLLMLKADLPAGDPNPCNGDAGDMPYGFTVFGAYNDAPHTWSVLLENKYP